MKLHKLKMAWRYYHVTELIQWLFVCAVIIWLTVVMIHHPIQARREGYAKGAKEAREALIYGRDRSDLATSCMAWMFPSKDPEKSVKMARAALCKDQAK